MTDMMDKFSDVTDGIDTKAIERWNLNPTMLKKLGEAYRMGWLHNVMSRITPLTLQRRDDYLAMSDIFIQDQCIGSSYFCMINFPFLFLCILDFFSFI